jgi:antitoxin ParD1/3/4
MSDDPSKAGLMNYLPDGRPQAKALRDQARAGGLRFEAYLPSDLADWLLDMIEQGAFHDPSEAVFVMLDEFRDFQRYEDLRDEVYRRTIQEALDDPDPGIPAEEVEAEMEHMLAEPRPEPAQWQRVKP